MLVTFQQDASADINDSKRARFWLLRLSWCVIQRVIMCHTIKVYSCSNRGVVHNRNIIPLITEKPVAYKLSIISVEKTLRKENVQFSSRGLFPFPEIANDAQPAELVSCILHVLGFTADGKPEAVDSNPAVGHNLLHIFRHSSTHSSFLNSKTQAFFNKFRILW